MDLSVSAAFVAQEMFQMRTTTLWCGVALGSLMIGTAGTAAAEGASGFYMDVTAGDALYPSRLSTVGASPILSAERSKKNDFAWAFAAGYHFNSYLAVELGFADLGTVTNRLSDASGATTNRGKVSVTAKGKTLSLLTHVPTGNWDPFFKVGVMEAVVDRDLDGDAFVLGQNEISGTSHSGQDTELKVVLGLGVRYAFSEQWAVSASVDYYPRLAKHAYDGGGGNVTSPRLGFAYRF
jgi:opacity protein-like surface antigen